MDGVVHTTACASPTGGRGAAIVDGSALSCGDDLRADRGCDVQQIGSGITTNFWPHPPLSAPAGPWATAITSFIMPLCSAPSMLFARASTARSARPSGIDRACAQRDECSYVMARSTRQCNANWQTLSDQSGRDSARRFPDVSEVVGWIPMPLTSFPNKSRELTPLQGADTLTDTLRTSKKIESVAAAQGMLPLPALDSPVTTVLTWPLYQARAIQYG